MNEIRKTHAHATDCIAKFLAVISENVPAHRLPDKIAIHNDAMGTELEMVWDDEGTITVNYDVALDVFAKIDLDVPESIAITRTGLLASLYVNSGITHVADLVYFELLPTEKE